MSKMALILALCLWCGGTATLAQDDEPAAAAPKAKSEAPAKPKPKAAAKSNSRADEVVDVLKSSTVRMSSVAAGSLLGWPIAAARMVVREDTEQAKAIPYAGESQNPAWHWFSRVVVIPTSMFSGIVASPFVSAVDAWKATDDKPFSKECFSLGEMDESIQAY